MVGMDGDGIFLSGDGNIVEGVQASSNGLDGIELGSRGTATGNTANFHVVGRGIHCTNDCVISGNIASNNADGIEVTGHGGLITGNAASGNDCDGLFNEVSSDGYSNNVMNGNNAGGHPSNCTTGCKDVCGGTSMGAGNTNLCSGIAC